MTEPEAAARVGLLLEGLTELTWDDGNDRGINDTQVAGPVHSQLGVHDSALADI